MLPEASGAILLGVEPAFVFIHHMHSNASRKTRSRNIKEHLEFLYEQPLFVAYIRPVVLLERIDTLPRNERVQHVLLLELASVHRLVAAFDLDSNGGLTLLAERDLFVISFDGGAVT